MRRLDDVGTALANFFASGVLALGPTLGPILWQLPATLRFEPGRMARFYAALPRTTGEAAALAQQHDDKLPDDRALTTTEDDRPLRHALEFRSETFCTEESFALMAEHDIACVVADSARRFPMALRRTSDLVYVRLHGDTELYASGYSAAALDHWAERCRAWAGDGDVFVYFDNDAKGFAPHDARALMERLGQSRSTPDQPNPDQP